MDPGCNQDWGPDLDRMLSGIQICITPLQENVFSIFVLSLGEPVSLQSLVDPKILSLSRSACMSQNGKVTPRDNLNGRVRGWGGGNEHAFTF